MNVVTGDYSNIGVYVILGVIALVVLIACIVMKKKK